MRELKRRVDALEATQSPWDGIWHRIVQRPGQTLDDAVAAYGADRIAAADRLVVRTIVAGGPSMGGVQ